MELIIVMAIIAIGAVMMVPNIGGWLPNYRLRAATRDIVSTMRVAQMKAVSSNVTYHVSFNEVSKSFVVRRQTTAGINNYVDDSDSQFLPQGITFQNVNFAIPTGEVNKCVVFNSNSTASSGSVILTNPRAGQKTISVFSTTGRVRVE